jgi:hypothetical protein
MSEEGWQARDFIHSKHVFAGEFLVLTYPMCRANRLEERQR